MVPPHLSPAGTAHPLTRAGIRMKKLQDWFQRNLRRRATLPPQRGSRPPSALERGSSISAEDPEELLAQDIAKLDLQRALVHHLEWCVVFNDRLHRANSLLTETEAHLPDAQESGLGRLLRARQREPVLPYGDPPPVGQRDSGDVERVGAGMLAPA